MEPRYTRRLVAATLRSTRRNVGGRWGTWTILGPVVLSGLVGVRLAGDDGVSLTGVQIALASGLIGCGIWILSALVLGAVAAPSEVDRQVRHERDIAASDGAYETPGNA